MNQSDRLTAETYLAPLKEAWKKRVELAQEDKKAFDAVAEQCDKFFSADHGFMWEAPFRTKFMGNASEEPRWKITIAKAFELVAIFGPTLFWKYPNRQINGYKPLELTPDLFGDPNDPNVGGMFQQILANEQREASVSRMRNNLMETYLNYSQREQTGGGLARHSRLAATEALVKGRGCLWPKAYQFPGSSRTLTGCFYGTVDNLLIDPDAQDPCLTDAKWIAKKHRMPTWEVERLFGYKDGSLEGRGTHESSDSVSTRMGDQDRQDRRNGKTFDQMEWYEIWSKGGVGTRLSDVYSDLHVAFEDVVGDYAYLCITDSINYPLNAPPNIMMKADDEQVKRMFRWRCADYGPEYPAYLDGRWPVCLLDFYNKNNCVWPIAPMAPGLGELIAINALMSTLVANAYDESQRIIGYLDSAAQDVESQLKGNKNPAYIKITEGVTQSVKDAVEFINHPPMNSDIFAAIDRLMQMFDKRTGLTDLVYGLNVGGVASRTAADIKAKQENLSVRPDDMASQVEGWQSEAAQQEKFLAAWNVEGQDIRPLLGEVGSYLWDELIVGGDPETLVREMKATVEAGSVRKPNKQRDADNINQTIQYLIPSLEQHANATTDTTPLNNFLDRWGDAIDMDMTGLKMGPRQPPPPPPEQQQAMQQQQQMEMAKQQAEVQIKQLDVQIKQMELVLKGIELELSQNNGQMEAATKQMEFQFGQAKHEQELQHTDEKFDQSLLHGRREFVQKLLHQAREAKQKLLSQQALDEQKVDTADELGDAKVEQARAMARAKPKTNGATSASNK